METRFLRDLKVSAIGMSCMGFTHAYGDGSSEKEGIRLVHKAFELGCIFLILLRCTLTSKMKNLSAKR